MHTLHLRDNLDFMRSLPDKHFDLGIGDPWYEIGMTKHNATGFLRKRFKVPGSMQDKAPPREYFDQLRRVCKKVFIFGGNYYLDFLGNCRGFYVWDKKTGANYFADGEIAWNNTLKCTRIFQHQWCGAFRESERGEPNLHPTQKPAAVYKDIILRCRLRADATVFDPNMGSGACGIAALDLGLSYVGIDIDPEVFRVAQDRIDRFSSQQQLFRPQEQHPELFDGSGLA